MEGESNAKQSKGTQIKAKPSTSHPLYTQTHILQLLKVFISQVSVFAKIHYAAAPIQEEGGGQSNKCIANAKQWILAKGSILQRKNKCLL